MAVPGFRIGYKQFALKHFSFEQAHKFLPSAMLVIGCDLLKASKPDFDNDIDKRELAPAVEMMTDGSVSAEWIATYATGEQLQELVRLQIQWDNMLETVTTCLKSLNDILGKAAKA